MSKTPNRISVVMVEHNPGGVITAFVREYPGVLVQAKNTKDAQMQISLAWKAFLDRMSLKHFEFETQSMPA